MEAPSEATLVLSASAFTLQLASIPEEIAELKLVVQASMPQSNGISDAYAKAVAIGTPKDLVTTAIALKTDYDAKYGAPTSATPKVFVKWFYVNTATGEKSGEMMGLATLA